MTDNDEAMTNKNRSLDKFIIQNCVHLFQPNFGYNQLIPLGLFKWKIEKINYNLSDFKDDMIFLGTKVEISNKICTNNNGKIQLLPHSDHLFIITNNEV